MKDQALSLILVFLSLAVSPSVWSSSLIEHEEERVVPLRRSLPLYLQHNLGSVSVQGWVQDRIKVVLKKRLVAETPLRAEEEFKKISLVTFEGPDRHEIRVGHSQGADLVSKMRNRSRSAVEVDLEIKAPYQTDLTLVLGEGRELKLEQWRGGVTVSGKGNRLRFSKLTGGKNFLVQCVECDTEVRESRIQGRISVGSKPLLLSDIEEVDLSIDGSSGEIRVERGSGSLNARTTTGRLNLTRFRGQVAFQSEDGGAFLNQMDGSADIQTRSGQVVLDFDGIKGPVRVDTEKGDIQISLVPQFEGLLDLMSLRGEVVVQFPYDLAGVRNRNRYGPKSPGRVEGIVGKRASPVIHAQSKEGGVRILRKAPSR